MKFEKINDNQIRCTLTREDLEKHQIRITELAYGTEKAKKLFRDMMQQAQIQCGFETDNTTPLMIEAIPVNMESVILIITKVEDPEELDTRFSKFSPMKNKESAEAPQLDGADSIIDLFQKMVESKLKGDSKAPEKAEAPKAEEKAAPAAEANVAVELLRLYIFQKLDDVIEAARALRGAFDGKSDLYKSAPDQQYYLVIHQTTASPDDFNRVCNVLSEYGIGKALQPSGEAHLKEHGKLITRNALGTLAQL